MSSPVTGSVTVDCSGSAGWKITDGTGSTVAAGSSSCPCSSTVLFAYVAGSAPLTKGTYQVVAEFNGEHHSSSSSQGSFTVVDGSSGGAIGAASGSLLVFAFLAWRRRAPKLLA